MKKTRVSVLGFGSWGIALSLLLHRNGHNVTAWMRSAKKSAEAKISRKCLEYLPGIIIPDGINITNNIRETAGADVVVFAAGSKATREVAELYKPFSCAGQIMVNASKGLEAGTNLRLSQVLYEVFPDASIATISGPCHAEELSQGIASTCVVASLAPGVPEVIQDVFMSDEFRVYTNTDLIGVELGGALKNVIALATGISDGLGNGDNSRAALITRGIVEISRLGVAMGASPETFSGLTGIGDLVATCTSIHSRNRRAGCLLGQGYSLAETLSEVHMLVEGVDTAKTALEFSHLYNVSMPITEEVNKVLFEGKNPKYTVSSLMTRKKTSERTLLTQSF